MKKIILGFLFVSSFMPVNAQKKGVKKAVVKAAKDFVISNEGQQHEVDTLNLEAGKPYVLLINIDPNSQNSQILGDDVEEKELKKNFKAQEFEIIKLYKYIYITLDNGQYIDASGQGNSYQTVVYWSGNNDDNVVVQEGLRKSTEFISQQIGVEKSSSYLTNTTQYVKEVASLQGKNNFTAKSKLVMDAYLKNISISDICKTDNTILFNQDQTNVKTITLSTSSDNNKKTKHRIIELDIKGYPIKITEDVADDKESYTIKFEYENDRIKKIVNKYNSTIFNYDNDKLIATTDLDGGIETKIYWLENGYLLNKSYLIMKEDGAQEMNSFSENKLEKGCVNYYINAIMWTNICNSKLNQFPYSEEYTSYQDGSILENKKYVLNKIDEFNYEETTKRDDETNKKIIKLNEKKLLVSKSYKDGKKTYQYILDYTYFN